MHTSYGDMDLYIPRDRNGEYEPQVIKNIKTPLLKLFLLFFLIWRYKHCIIHQIRNTTKFISYKDIKGLMADLKRFMQLQRKILL